MRTMADILEFPQGPKNTKLLRRGKNADLRTREYLTEQEIIRLYNGAKAVGRNRHRDYTLILVGYRHGFRVSELIKLRWEQVDFEAACLYVKRTKRGTPSTHPIKGDELKALRKLKREYPNSPYVFVSERDGPLSPQAVQSILKRAGKMAGFSFQVHPHMLRHSCGFKLANDGHDTRSIQSYLGHRNIQHTVLYTELAPDRFKNFWKD